MKQRLIIMCALILVACSKEKHFSGPNYFAEDFEGITSLDSMFEDGGNWSYQQITEDENYFELDTGIVHSGTTSMKFYAVKSSDGASKSAIANQELAFKEGDIIQFSGWFYIVGTADLNYIFLFDIEENTAIGAGPGMRIALEDPEGYLVVERNKYLENTLRQDPDNRIAFPRDQWVELKFESDLQRKDKGYVKVWQDGQLLIEEHDIQTMPKDKLFFIQGTKGIYNSIQIGITANSQANEAVVYVDDILIEKIN